MNLSYICDIYTYIIYAIKFLEIIMSLKDIQVANMYMRKCPSIIIYYYIIFYYIILHYIILLYIILLYLVCVEAHTWLCSGLSSGSEFRDCSWNAQATIWGACNKSGLAAHRAMSFWTIARATKTIF